MLTKKLICKKAAAKVININRNSGTAANVMTTTGSRRLAIKNIRIYFYTKQQKH